jgi:hypothetical protein
VNSSKKSYIFVKKITVLLKIQICIILLVILAFDIFPNSKTDSLKQTDSFSGIKYGFAISIPVHSQWIYENAYYYPLIMQGKIMITYHKKPRSVFFSNCISPQFNPVLITDPLGNYVRYDFGVNVEFGFNYRVGKRSFFYTAIGSGPHYMSLEKGRQAKGFLFSDNIVWAWRQQINTYTELIFEFKFRHISNAGIQKPNNGINNYFVGVGVLYSIE